MVQLLWYQSIHEFPNLNKSKKILNHLQVKLLYSVLRYLDDLIKFKPKTLFIGLFYRFGIARKLTIIHR